MQSAADSLLAAAGLLQQEEAPAPSHTTTAPALKPRVHSLDLSHASSQQTYHGSEAAGASPVGCRKRKAYKPRNSGDSESAAALEADPAGSAVAHNNASKRGAAPARGAHRPAHSPADSDSDPASRDKTPEIVPQRRRGYKRSTKAAGLTNSLAASRPRRAIKRGPQYDPDSFDLSTDGEDPGNATTSHEATETLWPMVPACVIVNPRRAAKFRHHDDHGFFEHPAL